MTERSIQADNQICYRALCAMDQERADAAPGRRRGILALALAALRKSSARKGFCVDCPYQGGCAQPKGANVVQARPVESHVTINWPSGTNRPSA